MKIVISPAKKLALSKAFPNGKYTHPVFLDEAQQVVDVMRAKTPNDIKQLMKLSDNLANLNWERFHAWQKTITQQARPAIFTFNGNVYNSLDSFNLPQNKLPKLNEKLRILSGLYGILRPFDLIYPYRMEMGTKISINSYKNLYAFWQDKITHQLNDEMHKGELLVNLASQEYFKAIDTNTLHANVIHIDFKEYKNDQLKTISIYAKIARGLMTRFIIQNNINTKEELKLFNQDGYAFDANLSLPNKLVFTR